ncbi:MAG TPA: GntR family transcriptional regulator [Acidobacteriaceae bacterium]|nr:GntR family transcriptional regulator [Acidobacteriaceae bacterium]
MMNGPETVPLPVEDASRASQSVRSTAAEIKSVIASMMAEEGERSSASASGSDRNCAHDRVRWTILERIMDGTYQPGERLKELTLAREFRVSQAPVREALRKLEAIGVVKSEPYRGARVRELSPTELRDAYQLRGILEQAATEFIPDFPEESLHTLEVEYAAMRAAAKTGDLQAVACHNRNFHRCIIERCQNQELVRAWKWLGICMRARLNVQRRVDQLPEAILSHQPIVDALRAGNLRHAGQLLRDHSFGFVSDLI